MGGKCDHNIDDHNESLPWFNQRDKEFQELQKIILNPELLNSVQYYTRFR